MSNEIVSVETMLEICNQIDSLYAERSEFWDFQQRVEKVRNECIKAYDNEWHIQNKSNKPNEKINIPIQHFAKDILLPKDSIWLNPLDKIRVLDEVQNWMLPEIYEKIMAMYKEQDELEKQCITLQIHKAHELYFSEYEISQFLVILYEFYLDTRFREYSHDMSFRHINVFRVRKYLSDFPRCLECTNLLPVDTEKGTNKRKQNLFCDENCKKKHARKVSKLSDN